MQPRLHGVQLWQVTWQNQYLNRHVQGMHGTAMMLLPLQLVLLWWLSVCHASTLQVQDVVKKGPQQMMMEMVGATGHGSATGVELHAERRTDKGKCAEYQRFPVSILM